LAHRRARTRPIEEVIQHGIVESLQSGITAVGEISQPGVNPQIYAAGIRRAHSAVAAGLAPTAPRSQTADLGELTPAESLVEPGRLQGILFREIIAPLPEQHGAVESALAEFLQHPFPPGFLPGLAPHAPYTVHPEILRQVIDLARENNLPLAFHLAESSEELALLQSGTGPLRDLLEARAIWPEGVFKGRTSLDYLLQLALAPRVLVIHGNYLREREIEFLATQHHLSLVFCPRTHRHFGHPPYPLREALARGIRVVVGTDGRSSTRDLNLLEDLREVAHRFPQLAPWQVLQMGTQAAAEALGLENRLGTLEPGKQADLLVVPVPAGERNQPLEALLLTRVKPTAFFQAGKLVWQDCPKAE
jgi:cytosine/adenosine deaminase-related metal-dependent hydrolase